jgi:peptidyl-prolyl cis-trans isomerase SurA
MRRHFLFWTRTPGGAVRTARPTTPMPRAAVFVLMAAVALAALLPGRALAQTRQLSTQGRLLDRIVAIVNNGVVLQSELDNRMKQVETELKAEGLSPPPESVLQKQVLHNLVLEHLELQQAAQDGIRISDDTLNEALQSVAARNHIPFANLPTALAQEGINYADYRQQMRNQLTIGLLRERDVLQRIVVTPREIDQFLARAAKEPTSNEEYDVSHILIAVAPDATPAQLAAAQRLAEKVDRLAKSGRNFAKLAITYSDSSDALKGGNLGWRKGFDLPTFLTHVVPRLKAGQISNVLRTASGFHIVKLDHVRRQTHKDIVEQVHVRHILLIPNAIQDAATVRERLEKIRKEILSGKVKFSVIAASVSQDPGSASEGGNLGWQSPNAFTPRFAAAISKLKVGQISKPFQTRYGWHIAQLLGRRKFNETQEMKRLHAMEAIRASRADEDTQLWLQRLRDDAYVRILAG